MRPFLLSASIAVACAAAAPPAGASSDAAWREFNTRVTRACVAASGIRNYRASTIVGFNDEAGKVAMLVTDRTRGSNHSKLCLYDKRARRAFVDDAEMWNAPPQPR
ncbi:MULTISPECIES: hypothetical protein [Sphingomonas]|jgi:hypothetical protein|uniref:hypothetical protein n=1 Tax=Sphingomonas TaxID=13687 RepID=UPI001AE1A1B8